MWIFLAICSAMGLGIYDIFKKLSVKGNNVLMVLMLNTIFSALYMSPFLIHEIASGQSLVMGSLSNHLLILCKSMIVLGSWMLGFFAIKHLPLTVQGPINASRPVMVLGGAVLIFGETLNWMQWCGLGLGFLSLFMSSRIGRKDTSGSGTPRWVWMSIGAAVLGAVSALFDKFLSHRFSPVDVQGWYALYQCIIMITVISILRRLGKGEETPFHWRWTIPMIALFLTVADLAYFRALSSQDALIAVVSMIRRGSVLVSFFYGVMVLRERQNLRAKLLDLTILLLGLIFLVVGSAVDA